MLRFLGKLFLGKLLSILLASAAVVLVAATPAYAHDDLSYASPLSGDKVTPDTAVIALIFTGLDPEGPWRITVTGPGGVPVLSGAPVLADEVTLCASVAHPLRTGTHTVAYEAIGADGHPIAGGFDFEVLKPACVVEAHEPCRRAALPSPGTQPQVDVRSSAGTGDDRRLLLIPLGVMIVIIAFLAFVAVRDARRHGAESQHDDPRRSPEHHRPQGRSVPVRAPGDP